MHIIEDNEQDIPSLRKANAELFDTVLRLKAQELATKRGWNCFDNNNNGEQ
jgi:hypothetical protein